MTLLLSGEFTCRIQMKTPWFTSYWVISILKIRTTMIGSVSSGLLSISWILRSLEPFQRSIELREIRVICISSCCIYVPILVFVVEIPSTSFPVSKGQRVDLTSDLKSLLLLHINCCNLFGRLFMRLSSKNVSNGLNPSSVVRCFWILKADI